jgi:hypothetical protein
LSSVESPARSFAVVAPAADASLDGFACPNPECCHFNRFGAGNLSVPERNGKEKAIRRLYCSACKARFSERKGSLLEQAKIPAEVVVRIVKCPEARLLGGGHGRHLRGKQRGWDSIPEQ